MSYQILNKLSDVNDETNRKTQNKFIEIFHDSKYAIITFLINISNKKLMLIPYLNMKFLVVIKKQNLIKPISY